MTDLDHLVFSFHALERMRERRIRVDEVQATLDQDGPSSYDLDGNHRYDATVDGRRLRVVTEADNSLFVVTVYVLSRVRCR